MISISKPQTCSPYAASGVRRQIPFGLNQKKPSPVANWQSLSFGRSEAPSVTRILTSPSPLPSTKTSPSGNQAAPRSNQWCRAYPSNHEQNVSIPKAQRHLARSRTGRSAAESPSQKASPRTQMHHSCAQTQSSDSGKSSAHLANAPFTNWRIKIRTISPITSKPPNHNPPERSAREKFKRFAAQLLPITGQLNPRLVGRFVRQLTCQLRRHFIGTIDSTTPNHRRLLSAQQRSSAQ